MPSDNVGSPYSPNEVPSVERSVMRIGPTTITRRIIMSPDGKKDLITVDDQQPRPYTLDTRYAYVPMTRAEAAMLAAALIRALSLDGAIEVPETNTDCQMWWDLISTANGKERTSFPPETY